jgi:alpha-D-ribose 1-methylphosphonate 5-phosphate C-P lyase
VVESDPVLRRIERSSLIACAVLALTAGIGTRRVDVPLGVLGGGALVAISYLGIKGGISALVEDGVAGSKKVAIGLVKFFTRYAILAVAAYVIMARLRLPPMAVFAGASSLVIAVMVEALRGLSQPGQ